MTVVKRTERGWAGHYICSSRCLFRRNTLIECGQVRIVVSTVGLQKSLSEGRDFEPVGCDHYFETAAFHAEWSGRYWDADVCRQLSLSNLGLPCQIFELDAADLANEMHETVVSELMNRMEAGETLENPQD